MRQKLIIRAIKDKLFSMGTFTNPSRIKALYSAIASHVFMDMNISDIIMFAQYFRSLDSSHILAFGLSDSCYQGASTCNSG